MGDVSWMALALALTGCGVVWTYHAWKRRGTASTVRGAAATLLPAAAWLTGTLELVGEVAGSVSDWALGFAFSPLVWVGISLFAVSVVLFGFSTRLPGGPPRGRGEADSATGPTAGTRQLPTTAQRGEPVIDDLADIEAILRDRGIS